MDSIIRKIAIFAIMFYATCHHPWNFAKMKVAWEEYQKNDVYRMRIRALGLEYAIWAFLKDHVSMGYLYSLSCEKDPKIKWRVRLMPWSVPLPAILQAAANQGFFDQPQPSSLATKPRF